MKIKWAERTFKENGLCCKSCGEEVVKTVPEFKLKMPYCGDCGKSIENIGHKYCGWCGAKITDYNEEDK